jgi:serine/threonine-protein kinase
MVDALASATVERAPALRRGTFGWALGAGAALTLVVLTVLGWRLRTRGEGAGNSIAVLPFVNMSSDRENEYFSDGITEELINALANVEGIRVSSRTSAFAFKGKDVGVRKIGEELHVASVLEGSVRREGGNVRVTAQLVNAADGYHLWSKTYDRELKSIFALEDELARSIAQALRHKLVREEAPHSQTASVETHDLYLRGRYFWNKRNPEGLRKAAAYFEQAIDKDPQYALAWAGLADSTAIRFEYGEVRASEVIPKATQAALRALELDPGLAETHGILGLIHTYDYEWAKAEVELRTAIELKPDAATLHHRYALMLIVTGRRQEARAEMERALQLEPTSLIFNTFSAVLHYCERDFDGAAAGFRKTLEMDPGFQVAHSQLGWALVAMGKYSEALAELDQGTPSYSQGWRGYALAMLGRKDEARRMLAEMEASAYGSAAARALVWIGLGDKDRALSRLQEACAERDWRLRYARVEPLYDGLRSDPRFHEVLRCAHLD